MAKDRAARKQVAKNAESSKGQQQTNQEQK